VAERVLVTDVEERAALAVCRGLAAAGYRVTGVAGAPSAVGHWSRSVDRRHTLPHPLADPEGFARRLAAIAGDGRHAALIPSTDAALVAVSLHRALFEPHVRLGLPPHDVVLRSLDKLALLGAAERVGLPPPPTETCDGAEAALAAAARIGYPVVVKPTRSLLPGEARMLTSAIAQDAGELRALLGALAPPFSIQRRRDGAVVSCGGVAAAGRLLGLCAARYGRTWRPEGGSASLSTTIELPEGLADLVERIVLDLGWEGMFELELVEASDGSLAPIDFNPRPYGSLALAIASGANLPALWCGWLLRGETASARSRPGVRYRWEEAELHNLLLHAAHREWRKAATVVRPYRRSTHAYFELADPGPLVAWVGDALRRAAVKVRQR
jgi:predicted ATP-grasp superfamily ATP-dependent carboligase